ncbi:uncharacterized protein LOC118679577 [Myotis myotis]|uniref:uncharacterized protein LOC118679577 n=1 Tax=Myotis myotis TaxID=51298 RepID=UPI00174E6D8E|nr:uncharacterized protein LOC118679577 [Myotis myotis]
MVRSWAKGPRASSDAQTQTRLCRSRLCTLGALEVLGPLPLWSGAGPKAPGHPQMPRPRPGSADPGSAPSGPWRCWDRPGQVLGCLWVGALEGLWFLCPIPSQRSRGHRPVSSVTSSLSAWWAPMKKGVLAGEVSTQELQAAFRSQLRKRLPACFLSPSRVPVPLPRAALAPGETGWTAREGGARRQRSRGNGTAFPDQVWVSHVGHSCWPGSPLTCDFSAAQSCRPALSTERATRDCSTNGMGPVRNQGLRGLVTSALIPGARSTKERGNSCPAALWGEGRPPAPSCARIPAGMHCPRPAWPKGGIMSHTTHGCVKPLGDDGKCAR